MPGTLVAMPGVLPDGEPVPADGSLPADRHRARSARAASASTCTCRSAPAAAATATSTPTPPAELGGGASREAYADTVLAELALAARVLGDSPPPRVDTVFVGGGTPDPAARRRPGPHPRRHRPHLGAGRRRRGDHRGQPGVGRPRPRCRRCGRPASPGSRWACSPPRRTCWRCWTAGTPPGRAAAAAAGGPRGRVRARQPGPDLRHAGGDAPRTSPPRWTQVVAAGVDHVSAYALIVEDGTRLAARMRRGELPYPSDDVAADRYLAAEAALDAAGLLLVRGLQLGPHRRRRGAGTTCSTGPAATGGASGRGRTATSAGCAGGTSSTRRAYAQRLAAGASPGQAREVLTADERAHGGRDAAAAARRRPAAGGAGRRPAGPAPSGRWPTACWTPAAYAAGRAVLTLRGRLLADAVVRDLLP